MATGKTGASGGSGWRPSGGPGGVPNRRGPTPEWIPAVDKPKRRTRRFKQVGLFLLAVGCVVALGVLISYLVRPDRTVLIVISADPAADAAYLDRPIDPYGWQSGNRFVKWKDEYEGAVGRSSRGLAPTVATVRATIEGKEDPAEDLARRAAEEAVGGIRFKCKTAVVYFGLHAGADAEGPFLFVAGGKKIRVKPLLQHLATQLRDKKSAVVLFDPGRLPPDPARGQLTDDFVHEIMKLNAEIASYGNMTVILGCKEGERAWESEEWQQTAFAHFVGEAMSGNATPAQGEYLTARDLFEYVEGHTAEWTGKNRPSAQHPIMLPTGDLERAAQARLVPQVHIDSPEPPGKPDAPLADLRAQWQAYDAVASLVPSPAVYTPRHWRRYRELLLRYEFVVRSGESESAAKLREQLDAERGAIERAARLGVAESSRTASTPLWPAAGGRPPAVDINGLRSTEIAYLTPPHDEKLLEEFRSKFREIAADGDPQKAARLKYSKELLDRVILAGTPHETLAPYADLLRRAWEADLLRPPEVQLALMLGRFYAPAPRGLSREKELLPVGPEPATRPLAQRALEIRRLAEDAAINPVLPPDRGHPYSEVLWRSVRDRVLEADDLRRKGEDLLFAATAEEHGESWKDLEQARTKYTEAIEQARLLRRALAVRDDVSAELPFIGRWVVGEGTDEEFNAVLALWGRVHALAQNIETGSAPAVDLNREALDIEVQYRKLRAVYDRRLDLVSNETNQQEVWLEREKLLTLPSLGGSRAADVRARLVKQNRETTTYLMRDTTDRKGLSKTIDRERLAKRLGQMAVAELGGPRLDDLNKAALIEVNSGNIGGEVAKIKGAEWQKFAETAGDWIGKAYRAVADAPDPAPNAPPEERFRAERFSRATLALDPPKGEEPAEVNRKWNWRRLFAALARRTVLDHWYDDEEKNEQAYFNKVATAYRDDADRLRPGDAAERKGHSFTGLLTDDEVREYEDLLTANRLNLQTDTLDRPRRWTTEKSVSVPFRLTAGRLPPDARAVVWAALGTTPDPKGAGPKGAGVRFEGGSETRRIRPLKENSVNNEPVVLSAATSIVLDEAVDLRRTTFFRGQVDTKPAKLRLSRMPDLVYTIGPPDDGRGHVAFIGPNNLDIGAVAFVIDFSPSMGKLSPTEPNSRINRALNSLEEVLRELPFGTRLSIRGFGVAPNNATDKPRAMDFESVFTAGKLFNLSGKDVQGAGPYDGTFDRRLNDANDTVNWAPGRLANLQMLMGSLRGTKQHDKAFTPLVRTMIHAANEDFEGVPANKAKLLVVLTDGGDNSAITPRDDQNGDPDYPELKRQLKKGLENTTVATRVVLIAEDKDPAIVKSNSAFAKEFGDFLKTLPTPGSLTTIESTEKLAKELADLLRPRVFVRPVDVSVDLPPDAYNGLPLRFDNEEKRESPDWSRGALVAPADYIARVGLPPVLGKDPLFHLNRGDRLLIKLSREAETERGVRFERVVWAQAVEKEYLPYKRQAAEKEWYLTAIGYRTGSTGYQGEGIGIGGKKMLDVLASVENGDLRFARPTDGRPIQQVSPEFVWWDFRADPNAPLVTQAPVYVWREYGYPAPVWRMRRWGWAAKDNFVPASSVQAWPHLTLPEPMALTRLTRVGSVPEQASGRSADDQPWPQSGRWEGRLPDGWRWKAEFTMEDHEFARNAASEKPDPPRPCLAVRVYLEPPESAAPGARHEPVFVRVTGAALEEHKFFRASGAYTGYFQFADATAADPAVNQTVKLFSVADQIAAPTATTLKLQLPEPFDKDTQWKNLEDFK